MTLLDRIVSMIRAGGPMPFERFMEVSLYEPEGFFGGETLRSEKGGDFLTSPEVSPLLGETLAAYVAHERERIGGPFQVVDVDVDVGAGSGSLLRPLLDAVHVDVSAVEASPAARQALRQFLPDNHVLTDLPESIRGVIVANELIDNLPMALALRLSS